MRRRGGAAVRARLLQRRDAVHAIGDGELGGKAQGLAFILPTLAERFAEGGEVRVAIPQLAVITTEHFDAFMSLNGLHEDAASDFRTTASATASCKATCRASSPATCAR